MTTTKSPALARLSGLEVLATMRDHRPLLMRLARFTLRYTLLFTVALTLVACGDDEEGGEGNSGETTESNSTSGATSNTPSNTTGGATTGGTSGGTTGATTSAGTGGYTCDYTSTGDFTPDPSDQCDLFAQDCPDGQACFLTVDGAQCFDPGLSTCSDSCEFLNDCQPGQICAGEPARCLAMCEPGSSCMGPAQCAGLNDRPDVGVCVPTSPGQACDLQAQDCEGDEACYLINGSPECAAPTENAAGLGASCMFANGCEPGLICVGVDAGELNCRRPCAPSAPIACGDAEMCQPLAEGNDDGVCVASE